MPTIGINVGFNPWSRRPQIGAPLGPPGGFGGLQSSPMGSAPYGSLLGPNGLQGTILQRLGLAGLPSPGAGYDAAQPPALGQPGAAPTQPQAGRGIGGWLATHGDALKGIGGALQGGAEVYSAIQQQAMERKRLQMEREREDRQRRDQEAGAQTVAPGYAALLQALMGRMGYGQGGA